jgi:hypothetical protein
MQDILEMEILVGYDPKYDLRQPSERGLKYNQMPGLDQDDDGVLETFGKGIVKGFLMSAKGLTGTVESLVEATGKENKFLSQVTENIRSSETKFTTTPDNWIEWSASVIGQALPIMGASFVAGSYGGSFGTVGRILGAGAVGFMIEGQNAYDEAIARGTSEGDAQWERVVVGTINAAIEVAQVNRLLGLKEGTKHSVKTLVQAIKTRAFGRMAGEGVEFGAGLLKTSVSEAVEEMLQEGVSIFAPALPFFEGKEALPVTQDGKIDWLGIGERVAAAGLAGAVAAPAIGVFAGTFPTIGNEVLRPGTESLLTYKNNILSSNLSIFRKAELVEEINQFLPEEMRTTQIEDLIVTTPVPEITEQQIREQAYLSWEQSDKTQIQDYYWLETEKQLTDNGTISVLVGGEQLVSLRERMIDKLKKINRELRPPQKERIKEETGKRLSEMGRRWETLKDSPKYDAHTKVIIGKGALKGELVSQFPSFLSDGFTRLEMDTLFQELIQSPIYNGNETFRLHASEGLEKLFGMTPDGPTEKGKLPEPNQIEALTPLLGKELTDLLKEGRRKQQTLGRRIFNDFIDIMNIPRATLASTDCSFGGRQAMALLFKDPKAWGQGMFWGYKAFLSEDIQTFSEIEIQTNPLYPQLLKTGVFLARVGGGITSEEQFFSRLAHSIPVIGSLVKSSERAYVTGLNWMRAQSVYNVLEDWIGTGKSYQDYKDLGNIINHLTGRATLGGLQNLAPALNALFFSPHQTLSKVQSFTDLVTVKSANRAMVAGTLVKMVSTGASILLLLSLLKRLYPKEMKELSVEYNPLSADFGKIRIGDTRTDYWAGYSQIARFVSQMAVGQIKSTDTKTLYEQDRYVILARFLQTKLSPAASIALDYYRGEDFKGDLIEGSDWKEEVYKRMVPMFVQDVADAIKHQGLQPWTIPASFAAFHGVGMMTYEVPATAQAEMGKNQYALQYFGQNWKDLGPEAQKSLRINFPVIDEFDRKAHNYKLEKKVSDKWLQEVRSSERYLWKSLPDDLAEKMQEMGITLGGINRRVGTDWFLNDTRYKQYKIQVAVVLNKIAPRIMALNLSSDMTTALFEKVMFDLKKIVRQKIVQTSNVEDLMKFKKHD